MLLKKEWNYQMFLLRNDHSHAVLDNDELQCWVNNLPWNVGDLIIMDNNEIELKLTKKIARTIHSSWKQNDVSYNGFTFHLCDKKIVMDDSVVALQSVTIFQ